MEISLVCIAVARRLSSWFSLGLFALVLIAPVIIQNQVVEVMYDIGGEGAMVGHKERTCEMIIANLRPA